MPSLAPRPFALLAALVAGAALTCAVMTIAGASGPAGWVAVSGAAACACGAVVGSSARVLPGAALAGVAAVALVLASGGGKRPATAEVRAYQAPAVIEAAPSAAPPRAEAPPPPPRPPLRRPEFVRRFYAAIDAGRFEKAWGRLGPVVQARSANFAAWRAGYATTLSNRVEDLRVEPGGAVRHVLVAVDRTPCGGTTERRFEVLWFLHRDGRTFTATDLDAVQLAGVDPALACG